MPCCGASFPCRPWRTSPPLIAVGDRGWITIGPALGTLQEQASPLNSPARPVMVGAPPAAAGWTRDRPPRPRAGAARRRLRRHHRRARLGAGRDAGAEPGGGPGRWVPRSRRHRPDHAGPVGGGRPRRARARRPRRASAASPTSSPTAPPSGAPGRDFSHQVGEAVAITAPELGTLVRRVRLGDGVPPWTFGAGALMRILAAQGLI